MRDSLRMNGSWDAYLASPADFAGADDITTNLAKEREPRIEIIKRVHSLISDSYYCSLVLIGLLFYLVLGSS